MLVWSKDTARATSAVCRHVCKSMFRKCADNSPLEYEICCALAPGLAFLVQPCLFNATSNKKAALQYTLHPYVQQGGCMITDRRQTC